ncbi:hypothetical protein EDD18DRAFT_1141568, partial [Armillaria luteobubalina]
MKISPGVGSDGLDTYDQQGAQSPTSHSHIEFNVNITHSTEPSQFRPWVYAYSMPKLLLPYLPHGHTTVTTPQRQRSTQKPAISTSRHHLRAHSLIPSARSTPWRSRLSRFRTDHSPSRVHPCSSASCSFMFYYNSSSLIVMLLLARAFLPLSWL